MTLHKYIPDSVVVYNRKIQHCASLFSNGVYDIRGRIQSKDFLVATTEDMKYMQRHFVPSFDEEASANHLKQRMKMSKRKDDIVCGTKIVI